MIPAGQPVGRMAAARVVISSARLISPPPLRFSFASFDHTPFNIVSGFEALDLAFIRKEHGVASVSGSNTHAAAGQMSGARGTAGCDRNEAEWTDVSNGPMKVWLIMTRLDEQQCELGQSWARHAKSLRTGQR